MSGWPTVVAFLVLILGGGQRGHRDQKDARIEQHFYCNTGYTIEVCASNRHDSARVLERFDLRGLEGWTWVLVRSDDWKPILRRVGRDPDSPAFTILEKRQTFLEEALFAPRGAPLLRLRCRCLPPIGSGRST